MYKAHTHAYIYIKIQTHKNKHSDLDFPTTITSRHSSLKHATNLIHIEASSNTVRILYKYHLPMKLSCKVEPYLLWRNKGDSCSQERLSAPMQNVPLQQRSRHARGREMMHFGTRVASSSWHGYYQPLALWSNILVFPACRDTATGVCSSAP